MTVEAPSAQRVLLLAGSFADAAPSMDLAVAVASRIQGSLEGILVQDPRAEGATPVRVDHRANALVALSGERLRLAYAVDARAFRSRLKQAATSASLHYRFRTESGLLPDLAIRMTQPGDFVILGHRRFLALRGPVISLDENKDGPAALLATDLARRLGLRLRILPADTQALELDLLAASMVVLSQTAQAQPHRLNALIETARCPVLFRIAEQAGH